MPRGYMEGPASEEAERRAEEAAHPKSEREAELYSAVYGCTDDDPEPHFIGWRADVDPDELWASGKAWGVSVRKVAVETD